MFKRVVAVFLVLALLLSMFTVALSSASAAEIQPQPQPQPDIRVYYDGKLLRFNVPPTVINGTTLVQFRTIFEALGYEVTWNQEKQEVFATDGNREITLTIGNKRAITSIGGMTRNYTLDVAPMIINGSTMVPLRFISEFSGKFVDWHQAERKITIQTGYDKYRTYEPYARDSFVPLEDAPNLTRLDPDFYQDGQYFYVTWYQPVSFQDFTGYDFYVSVAKGSNWIIKNKKFHTLLNQKGTNFLIQFYDGAYYVRDSGSIKEIRPTHEGKDIVRYLANGLPRGTNSRDWMRPILVDGTVGILYGVENNFNNIKTQTLRIYYNLPEDTGYAYENRYYEIKDIYGILQSLRGNPVLVYNPKREIVYILESTGYRQLDTSIGDLKYDKEGNDLVIPYHPEIASSGTKVFVSNGNMYLLYRIGKEEKYRFSNLLYTMSVGEPQYTQITSADLSDRFITYDEETRALRMWKFDIYSRKPAVHMVEYRQP